MSLRSVNMNRVIQLNNPPKWFPHLYIHSTSISETKKCRKKQDPEVERNSPGDFLFKSCFVEMFASQKKKTSIFEVWFLALKFFLSLENQSRWAGEVS